MNFQVDQKEHYTLLTLQEEKLGGIVSPELKAKFVELNSQGVRSIIIDMEATRYCDSSGLSAILVGNRLCKNSNGTFVMCGLQPMVSKLVNISQLNKILTIVPTSKEAIDYVLMEDVSREMEND